MNKEQEFVDSCATKVSASRLSIENYVGTIRAGGNLEEDNYQHYPEEEECIEGEEKKGIEGEEKKGVEGGQDFLKNKTSLVDMGPVTKEDCTEDVLVEVPGHKPIRTPAGLSIIKTPDKSVRRADKPNIDKQLKLKMLRQIIELGDPLEASTLDKSKDLLRTIYQQKVETFFHGKLIKFRWSEKYKFKTLVVLWWRRGQLPGGKKGSLRDKLLEVVHNLKLGGMQIETIFDHLQ